MNERNKVELHEYKKKIISSIAAGIEANDNLYSVDIFIEDVSELLTQREIYDDIDTTLQYVHSNKGMNIQGYNWNETEKILSGIVIKFSNSNELETINQSDIEKLGKQCAKFISSIDNKKFIESLAPTDPGKGLAETLQQYKEKAVKFRVIVITNYLMSDRVKRNKIKIDNIFNKKTSIEVCDLERIMNIEKTDDDTSENFTVDLSEFTDEAGLKTLKANSSDNHINSYLCIMPGNTLSKLFDEYGQKLLESNVRTFLQFKGKVNAGIKKTLLRNPEDFFSYNNGLTVTASRAELKKIDGELILTELDNMQIVNGGQTTSAIYFSPKEKGQQEGYDYRNIDLSKVFVQMKLTVINDKDKSEEIKANVAQFANSQNAVQASDLISNHPLHRKLENHSRKHEVPIGDSDTSTPTKWFYERARGQYATKMRQLTNATKQKTFQYQNPKNQVFSKTDLAKYEGTWMMMPHIVKLGAQKCLAEVGKHLIARWDKNENNFEIPYYKDLIAKMILFRTTDRAIQYESDWYKKGGGGLKAETVTYTIALLRHKLIGFGKDLNLNRIYENQNISDTLKAELLNLGKIVKANIEDIKFRDGAANPSEFCKRSATWEKFKKLIYETDLIHDDDTIGKEDIKKKKEKAKSLNKASASMSSFDIVQSIPPEKWLELLKFISNKYSKTDKKIKLITKLSTNNLKAITEFEDYELAIKVLKKAEDEGFISD